MIKHKNLLTLSATLLSTTLVCMPATAETRKENTAKLLASLSLYQKDEEPTVEPAQVIGNDIHNAEGEVIGSVETVVQAPDKKTYAVVDTKFKGPTDFEKETITLPLNALVLHDKKRRLETSLSVNELKARPQYDAVAYVEVGIEEDAE